MVFRFLTRAMKDSCSVNADFSESWARVRAEVFSVSWSKRVSFFFRRYVMFSRLEAFRF